jgi:hypothetical protein
MADKPPPGVIESLPHSRPHRRSDKRAAKPQEPPAPQAQAQAPKPRATKPAAPKAPNAPERPVPEPSPGVLETAVQAAAELAEIGLHVGARALRSAVSRLPRP